MDREVICVTLWLSKGLPVIKDVAEQGFWLLVFSNYHNGYFWSKPQQTNLAFMAQSIYRSQRMNTSADIIQNEYNEYMDSLLRMVSCPHLHAWWVRDNPSDKHQGRNVKHIQYLYSSITFPHLPPIYIQFCLLLFTNCFLKIDLLFLARV